MIKRILFILTILFSAYGSIRAQKMVTAKSPDGNIRFTVQVNKDALPTYNVYYQNTQLVKDGALGFEFDNGTFGENVAIGRVAKRAGVETYDLVAGKSSHVEHAFREITVPLKENKAPYRQVDVVIRLFNDGAAFRYSFPEQEKWASYVMYDELTSFDLANNPEVLTMFLGSYRTSHEGMYSQMKYTDLPKNQLIEMPSLFHYDGVYMAITEAAIRNYAGMYLMNENNSLRTKLAPNLDQPRIKVKATLPHRSPWRVMMIGEEVGTLIASNILTSLNDPCAVEDVSWVKPGKTTFSWWNGNVVPDSTFLPGNNFYTNKYYIDFAKRAGLDFHSIYGYAEQPWYEDENMSFEFPSETANVMKTVKSLDMDATAKYAASQGVGLHMWVNWKPLYARLEEALTQFEKWGVRGMMVDFMDRDDQEMIRIQEEILKKSAEHKIFVQFHGSSKPSGLSRTYPNEFAREGTRNYECYKWSKDMSADLEMAVPFTRLLAGVTDFHLGGFRAVPKDKFRIQYTNPLVTNTRCHMLGMYVVLECYLGMVCDSPMAYEGQQGFEFIQKVPTTWDETVVPAASVMEYATVARRSGQDWYVGAINNTTARTVSIKTDFLGVGNYLAEIYADADDVDSNPNHLVKRTIKVNKASTIDLHLANSGGTAIHIYPEKLDNQNPKEYEDKEYTCTTKPKLFADKLGSGLY